MSSLPPTRSDLPAHVVTLERRVADLEASLKVALAAERAQKARADALEARLATAWSVAVWKHRPPPPPLAPPSTPASKPEGKQKPRSWRLHP